MSENRVRVLLMKDARLDGKDISAGNEVDLPESLQSPWRNLGIIAEEGKGPQMIEAEKVPEEEPTVTPEEEPTVTPEEEPTDEG